MNTLKRIYGMPVLRWIGLSIVLVGLSGSTCTEDRSVDVVVAADVIAVFEATGQINVITKETTVHVNNEIDIQQILDDNGIDSLKSITVQSAFIQTTRKDPTAGRTITGSVLARKGTGTDGELIALSSVGVNDPALEDWYAVPLESPGVAVLNDALLDVAHSIVTDVTFTVSGTSTPVDIATDFEWKVKLRVNLVGTAKVTVFEPI